MNLSQLRPPRGQKHKQQRIGQGMGTGRGKFSGRGAKGAKSVSGYSRMRGFEGGQMPLHRRLPKRGFTNIFKKEYEIVNLGTLDKLEGDSFDVASLIELGVIHKPAFLQAGAEGFGLGRADPQNQRQGAFVFQSRCRKDPVLRRDGGSDRRSQEVVTAQVVRGKGLAEL